MNRLPLLKIAAFCPPELVKETDNVIVDATGDTSTKKNLLAALLAAYLLVLSSGVIASPSDSWGNWQRDAGHTGYQPDTLMFAKRQFAWSESVRSSPTKGLAASSAMVFTTDGATNQPSFSSSLVAQRMTDGHGVWSVSFPTGTNISAPAFADNMVFVVENVYVDWSTPDARYLDAFVAETGTPVYRVPLALPGEMFDSPTVSAGHVYIESEVDTSAFASSSANTFGSFNEATGALEWQSTTGQGDGTTPTPYGSTVFGFGTTLNLLDPATGNTTSSIVNPADSTDFATSRAPTVFSNSAFAIQGGHLLAFDLAGSTIAWQRDSNAFGQIATDGAELFYLSSGALEVRDATSAALLWGWEAPQPGPVDSGALKDNLVITKSHVIATDGSKTYFINRQTHFLDSAYSVGGLLALANDKIIVADADGIVTAFAIPSDELFSSSFE